MAQVKLAELLLRRRQLQEKVEQLKTLRRDDLYQVKLDRKQAHEGVDDIWMAVPVLSAGQVTGEYDFHAHQLRLVDGAIQQANWGTEVDIVDNALTPYVSPAQLSRDASGAGVVA